MKAITVQQPWAWAILAGKNIENRSAVWDYRGPLAIHAGKQWSERGAHDSRVAELYATVATLVPGYDDLIRKEGLSESADGIAFGRGAIIGVVDLVDAHRAVDDCCAPWGESESMGRTDTGQRTRVTHLVLEDPRRIEPIECKGALGLWTPQQEIVDHLAERCLQCNNPRSYGVGCCTNDRNRPHHFASDES